MSGAVNALLEWANPAWGRHRAVPRMEAGLRPNLRLDEATELVPAGDHQPDDIVVTTTGAVLFSDGRQVFELRDGRPAAFAGLDGDVAALAADRAGVLAAVEGHGIVRISTAGTVEDVCTAESVRTCVTALAPTPDGAVLATIGSLTVSRTDWARALVTGDRTGRIVRVAGADARVVAERLGWPSGIGVGSPDEAVVSISLEHRVEARSLGDLGKPGRAVTTNLPVYPGRIRGDEAGYWLAAPYVRNRVTEMLLDEPGLRAEMVETIRPDEWFVPRLRAGGPFTDTMQMGQLRVLGVVKSWAPARSCGLVFRMDREGRVLESAHARVDSDRHGVTGIALRDGELLAAVLGHGSVLAVTPLTRTGGQ